MEAWCASRAARSFEKPTCACFRPSMVVPCASTAESRPCNWSSLPCVAFNSCKCLSSVSPSIFSMSPRRSATEEWCVSCAFASCARRSSESPISFSRKSKRSATGACRALAGLSAEAPRICSSQSKRSDIVAWWASRAALSFARLLWERLRPSITAPCSSHVASRSCTCSSLLCMACSSCVRLSSESPNSLSMYSMRSETEAW
mmetsp:Transcript_22297/g.61802  ORF Transcript_22297/g.61802 Transcript_22297/m.61802 type:complete len:203 (-) Transcript_22297:13-621(-)